MEGFALRSDMIRLAFGRIIPAPLLKINVRGQGWKLTDLFRTDYSNLANNAVSQEMMVAWIR